MLLREHDRKKICKFQFCATFYLNLKLIAFGYNKKTCFATVNFIVISVFVLDNQPNETFVSDLMDPTLFLLSCAIVFYKHCLISY